MFEPFSLGHRGGPGSDRHGVIERHPALATPAAFFDQGDCATNGAVAEHGAQVSALGQHRAEVQDPRSAKQARSLC